MDKNKKIALLLYGILAVLVIASVAFLLRPQSDGGTIATIQVGRDKIMEIALDTAKDGTISIQEETGLPITFEVKDHAIRFLDSDCPDKVCVHSGFLKRDMDIASCLPNNTVLTVSVED
ncbi:MAG: NusG domain II-containing protein [Angelakisella sp.]